MPCGGATSTTAVHSGISSSIVVSSLCREADAGVEPVASAALGSSADAQGQAVERAVDTAKRIAARGGHAVVLIDGLDGMHPPAARKTLAAARNLREGGSLTVIATALLLIPEAWELTKSASFLKVGGIVVNLLVVAYLVWRLRREPVVS